MSAWMLGSVLALVMQAGTAAPAPVDERTLASIATSCPLFQDGFEPAAAPLDWETQGGYRIHVDRHTVSVTDPIALNRIEWWGDPHENLNGKHIKDWGGEPEWDGSRRTLLLGDGTRLTASAPGAQDVMVRIAIYDGARHVEVDTCSNRILHQGDDPFETQQREAAEYDGETALFETNATTGIATETNVYNEDASFQRIEFDWPLGSTGGHANPNQVNDYYDDPRLGHT